MTIKPNNEERGIGAGPERHRDLSANSGSSMHTSAGENVARADSGSESTAAKSRSNRGFASMDRDKQREIASKGGRAAHEKGTAHEFDAGEARAAGRKGGVTVSRNKEHMAAIGRRGGEARGANRAARQIQAAGAPDSAAANGSTPNSGNSGNSGSSRVQSDREVGLKSTSAANTNSAESRRPGGNSFGGETRNAAASESNVDRL